MWYGKIFTKNPDKLNNTTKNPKIMKRQPKIQCNTSVELHFYLLTNNPNSVYNKTKVNTSTCITYIYNILISALRWNKSKGWNFMIIFGFCKIWINLMILLSIKKWNININISLTLNCSTNTLKILLKDQGHFLNLANS